MSIQPVAGRSRSPSRAKTLWMAILATLAATILSPVAGEGVLQYTNPHLPPELNRFPDANEANDINSQEIRRRNFDRANAIREKKIDDDTAKLLILAKDLRYRTEAVDNRPLPPILVREAEVIELLAHDVQAKMKLTVGGG
jgi:hypothetical protein